jgi:hypothetical protein
MNADSSRTLESLAALDDQSFLGKAYIALLGRPIDPHGFRDYFARLASGVPRSVVWDELASSEEAHAHAVATGNAPNLPQNVADLLELDGELFVRQAYLALLGRPADPAGLKHYAERLAAGVPKAQIVADIHSGQEGQAYGARLQGVKDLVARVRRFGADAYECIDDVLDLPDEGFIRGTYRMLLGRAPDHEGKRIYSDLLALGMSRMYVVREIARSPEAREKRRKPRGLAKALTRYERANRRNWGGWYLLEVKGVQSDLPREREARAAAYALRALLQRG